MTASSDAQQFQVYYSDPETCSVNEALNFLAATHDPVFKPKLNADVFARLDDMVSSDDDEDDDEGDDDEKLMAALLENSGDSDLCQSNAKTSLDAEEVEEVD
ncbi:hypothetical protein HDU77_008197 [Chytriomyces hyalinus]|nr:hypothetical protein HDU77_008197 [Chytriomyces hyalinus]